MEANRLGILDSGDPLVVLQWGGAIAINYEARPLGIKRGMYWNEICKLRGDGNKSVRGIHVEVTGLDDEDENDGNVDDDSRDSRAAKYEKQFSLTPSQKADQLKKEDGYIPSNAVSKASLERYRYSSGLIFKEIKVGVLVGFGKSRHQVRSFLMIES